MEIFLAGFDTRITAEIICGNSMIAIMYANNRFIISKYNFPHPGKSDEFLTSRHLLHADFPGTKITN